MPKITCGHVKVSTIAVTQIRAQYQSYNCIRLNAHMVYIPSNKCSRMFKFVMHVPHA